MAVHTGITSSAMYTSNSPAAGPAMSNPLTTQSQVVLNGRYDRYFTNYRKRQVANKRGANVVGGTVDDQNFDVMPRELGMMLRQTFDADITRPINYEKDREIRIFTSANALPALDVPNAAPIDETDPKTIRKWKAHLRDQLVFVGVPLTKVLHANDNQPDMVSIQVSGSTTIFNTGIHDINAFDLVMWDIPLTAVFDNDGKKSVTPAGLPETKKCFHTVPLRMGARDDATTARSNGQSIAYCTNDDIFRSMFDKDSGNAAHGVFRKRKRGEAATAWDSLCNAMWASGAGTDDEEKKDALKRVLEYWTHTHMRYMHRVIGVALSKARPGEPFDIILQKAY